jgi:hypothetical protein
MSIRHDFGNAFRQLRKTLVFTVTATLRSPSES